MESMLRKYRKSKCLGISAAELRALAQCNFVIRMSEDGVILEASGYSLAVGQGVRLTDPSLRSSVLSKLFCIHPRGA